MNEDNSAAFGDVTDPLSMDLTNTSTKKPLLAPGVGSFQITKIERKESKKTPGQFSVNVELATLETATDHNTGELINPGWKVYHTILITPTGKMTADMIKRNMAQFMDSVFGNHEGAFGPLEKYIGETVTARIAVEPSEQYGDQNRLTLIKKA